MPEEDNGSGLKKDIDRLVGRLRWKTAEKAQEVSLKIDKDAVPARELLEDISGSLGFLINPANSPKILEVNTPTLEFVSIRRVEKGELEHRLINLHEAEDEDPNNTFFETKIPSDSIEEGQVLVLALPHTVNLRCKNAEVERELLEKISSKIEDFYNFNWPAMMSEAPEIYKYEDWEPESRSLTLVTRRNGKFYRANIIRKRDPNLGYDTVFFQRLYPKKSQIEFSMGGYFQSNEDIEANRKYLKEWGMVYLLTEGSSEKDEEKVTGKLTELIPTKPVLDRD